MTTRDEIETRLAEIEARDKAATPGPWVAETYENVGAAKREGYFAWSTDGHGHDAYNGRPVATVWRRTGVLRATGLPGSIEVSAEDAAFIVAAREDVPWLIAQVRAALAKHPACEAGLTAEHAKAVEYVVEALDRIAPRTGGFDVRGIARDAVRRIRAALAEAWRVVGEQQQP